jgi:hypothetical protein
LVRLRREGRDCASSYASSEGGGRRNLPVGAGLDLRSTFGRSRGPSALDYRDPPRRSANRAAICA